jgi:Cof subfamily protein (haloacid dehalogenase superfamily)
MSATGNHDSYRFIALDLDGTVLDASYRVSPAVREALENARDRGFRIIVSTGRVYAATRPHAEKLGHVDGYVCSNGADVYDSDARRIARHHLGERESRALAALSRRHASLLTPYLDDAWYYERETPYVARYESRTGFRGLRAGFDTLPSFEFTKCIFHDEPAALAPIAADIQATLGDSVRAVYSSPFMLEVMAPDISKSRGLAECLARMGGSLEQTIAFGDAENDLDMLLAAGIGVAMGNASDEMKRAVGRVAPSVDDDGVAVWLSEFYGSR